MLRAQNLTKTYNAGKKVALSDFSIEVPKASIYGLLGPNGAGKTSFIRIINQITQPDSGTVFVDGQQLMPSHIKDIGFMPEERGLYKNMTVGDQILYFGELKGMSRTEAMNQAKFWFDRLNIEHWWAKKLSELSKGMAQKIQFVVTVLHRPKLLILDEPFSGFDPVNANLIKDQILDLKKKGTTIILSTHRMESVEEMCDYVALINQSKKILDGTVQEVRERFKQNRYNIELSDTQAEPLAIFKARYSPKIVEEKGTYIKFNLEYTASQNELLTELMKVGQVHVFNEQIPSMNEVFIRAIKKTSV